MTNIEFSEFWSKKYPEVKPINYLFHSVYKAKWLRIHSLPTSKRYPDDESEWDILLSRQNTVINDLLLKDEKIIVVFNLIDPKHHLFNLYDLVFVDKYKDDESTFKTYIYETTWSLYRLNTILREIADEKIRGFIIGKDCLISPYDGGMDVYTEDVKRRDAIKKNYKKWLSKRADGM